MSRPLEWFVSQPGARQRLRLFCFPYAGGGSAIFRPWVEPLADVASVVAVRPPGRESRLKEPAFTDAVALASAATEALTPLLLEDPSRPYALFGHSLGATVAFEVARAVRRLGLPAPRALLLSARTAPTEPMRRKPIAHLPRPELLKELTTLAGTPPEVIASEELMDLLLPLIRADFTAAEQYRRPEGAPLDQPLFVYGGTTDEDLPRSVLDAWQRESTGPFSLRMFEGGHFFINEARALVLRAVHEDLRTIAEAPQ